MRYRFAAAACMRRRSAAWKHRPARRTNERKKSILRRCSVKDAVAYTAPSPEPPQDAPQEYSQSRRAAQVVRLQAGKTRHNRRWIHRDRGGHRAPGQQPADLLGLRREAARLRSASDSKVRVCAAVEHYGVLRLRDAAGEVPNVRRDCRTGAVGRRQRAAHDQLSLVPGPVGQAALVARDG